MSRIKSQLSWEFASAILLVGIALLAYNFTTPLATGRPESPGLGSSEFLRGDSNDDGNLDIADPLHILLYLFGDGEVPACLAAADTDDNSTVQIGDAISLLNYLFRGGPPPALPFPAVDVDPTPDLFCRGPELPPLPPVGSLGGPDRELTAEEALSWRRGLLLFDSIATVEGGLGPLFNGDSCRGCHHDPVVGGAGGLDVDVVRFGYVDGQGLVSELPTGPVASRLSVGDTPRDELHVDANLVETRQTPTLFGLGLVDRIRDEVLLGYVDPNDVNGDGITGRARMVDGRPGRFGHKADVPTLIDFTADALFNELGLTVNPAHSIFAGAVDGDAAPDPELSDQDFADLAFFISHLAPPSPVLPINPTAVQRIEEGESFFLSIGCGGCHVPTLVSADGVVNAYSDFLLHDVGDPARYHVKDHGVESGEFRTPPLWGLRDTAPYLHDGSAETIRDAILNGHYGEASAARQGFESLTFDSRSKVEEFLLSR